MYTQLIQRQSTTILNTRSKVMHLEFINTQIQYGGADCGLFAIAYVIAITYFPDARCDVQHLLDRLKDGRYSLMSGEGEQSNE